MIRVFDRQSPLSRSRLFRHISRAVFGALVAAVVAPAFAQDHELAWSVDYGTMVTSSKRMILASDGNIYTAGRQNNWCVRYFAHSPEGVKVREGGNGSSVEACRYVDFGLNSALAVYLVTSGVVYDDVMTDALTVAPARRQLPPRPKNFVLDKYFVSGGASGADFGGADEDRMRSVVVDAARDAAYLTGGGIESDGETHCDTWRWDSGVATRFRVSEPGRHPRCHAIVQDRADNLVIAGTLATPGGVLVHRLRWVANPNPLWSAPTYIEAGPDTITRVTALATDAVDDIYVAGSVAPRDRSTGSDWLVVKLDAATGAVVWSQTLVNRDPEIDAEPRALAVAPDGAIYVTGSWPGVDADVRTVRLEPADGALTCEGTYSGPFGFDRSEGLAFGPSGDLYVAGRSDRAADATDFLTLRYSTTCDAGALTEVWADRLDLGDCESFGATAMGVDDDESVYVSGQICNTMVLAKYAIPEP